eukprot:Protomagalhaensia_wolfi_Nauph_80__479@NODE_1269_length_1620_cov_92_282100_g978_i0_p1_GENE_NODE_1269_length_1620_cov_92_282100_g978_i0NODE_1269_length_1620_cov_92_282100_g978_i0_p1_ORF_typecomplete_len442_score76_51Nucleoside_tran/PF01733_18/1_4e03Nucleoside_tran/PF01733_18/6_6e47MFS_2/PF13347_6/42MFS_2/PF13347_6/0_009MFS_2/PF13347_6/0_69DUF4500/PF14937_6/2_1DUF4500/PF14937_6/1_6e02Vpu/PF00558_19/9e03Vpu/PF00558_19/1_7e03Vpu/PF00558_19/0_98Vpu/PF00558_19/1_8e04UPF0242/PF06785_11/9UPF0242/PF06785_
MVDTSSDSSQKAVAAAAEAAPRLPQAVAVTKQSSLGGLAHSEPHSVSGPQDEEAGGGTPAQDATFSWLFMLIFILIGTSHLTFWNGILNILGDVRNVYFEDQPSASDTLTAAQTSGTLIAALINSVYGKINIKVFLVCAIVHTVSHILTPVVLYAGSLGARAGLLHTVYVLAGLSNGGMQSFGYALSGAMPYIYTGAVSAGNGLAGIVTFVVWLIVKAVDAEAVMKNLWVTMGVGCFCCVAAIFIVLWLYKRPEVRQKVDQDNAKQIESKHDVDAPSYGTLIKDSWPMILVVFTTFFYTLAFFPNVGPIRWSGSGNQLDVTLGMFQVGDFVGRFMPNLAFFILTPLWVYIVTVIRFVFIVFFVLFWKQSHNSPWDSFAFQAIMMLLFAITNGWMSSCAMIHAPSMSPHAAYRGKVAAVALVFLLLGINLGSWTSRLIVLGD